MAINLPLLHLLAKRFDYPDKDNARDIGVWIPIAGDIPVRNALRPRVKLATATAADWTGALAERNKRTVGRAGRLRIADLGADCWRKSKWEIESGWLSGPRKLTYEIPESANLTRRFPIYGKHGNGPCKVRIVDDMDASGANAISPSNGTAVPDSLDSFLAVSSYYGVIRPGCELLAASTDFGQAYKTDGIPEDDGLDTAVLLGPPSGALMVSRLRTQPPGRARPAYWGIVASLIQWILRARYGAPLPICADGCLLTEPTDAVTIAYAFRLPR